MSLGGKNSILKYFHHEILCPVKTAKLDNS